MNAVKISNSSPESVNTICLIAALSPFCRIASSRLIIDRIKRLACSTVEESVIFRAAVNKSVSVTIVFRTVADYVSLAVFSSVCGLAGHFSFSVQIEICNEELRIMRSGTDIVA